MYSTMQHLVYLHGFLSSPDSQKAQQTLCYAKKHFPALNVYVPQLPGDINKAVKVIDSLLDTLPLHQTRLIGSSMGGFLATYCMQKYYVGANNVDVCQNVGINRPQSLKAVLINPAVTPFDLLRDYLGTHVNPYTGETFYIVQQHIDRLKQLYAQKILQPSSYKVLLQTGDETLDSRLAVEKYAGADIQVEHGGNHSFVGYEQHLPSIFRFLYNLDTTIKNY